MLNVVKIVVLVSIQFSMGLAVAADLHWLTEPSVDVGNLADHEAEEVKVSSNGRYISFVSKANNLVNNDFNHIEDLFIRDMQTGITELVSVTQGGAQASFAGIYRFSRPSSDGRYVAFASDAVEYPGGDGDDKQLFVKDLVTGTLTNESVYATTLAIDITSGELYLADDGLSIIFSTRSEVDPLHVGNNSTQVYAKDLTDDSYALLSTSLDGTEAADGNTNNEHVSSNGRFVLLASRANNLSADVINNSGDNLFILDRLDNTRTLVNITPGGSSSSETSFSGLDGQISDVSSVVFTSKQSDLVANDTNNRGDVFYYDNGVVTRINVDSVGNELINNSNINDVAISADGSRVVFTEYSDELFPADLNDDYDLYAYTTATGALTLVSQNDLGLKANGSSYEPQLNDTGNRLVFTSLATDLSNEPAFMPNLSIFHHNFNTGLMRQEHVGLFAPETLMENADNVRISNDQLTVVYASKSPNLVAEPLNDTRDLFALDRQTNNLTKIASNISSYEHDLSPSGRYVSFRTLFMPPEGVVSLGTYHLYRYDRQTDAFLQIAEGFNNRVNDQGAVVFDTFEDLVASDSNGQRDVYAYNPNNGQLVLVSEDLSGDAAVTIDFDLGGTGGEVWVTYTSDNDNIVNNDNNNEADVFLKQLGAADATVRVSQKTDGTEANGGSDDPAISEDGRWVAFVTEANNLTNDDYTDANDLQVLLYDLVNEQHTLVSLNESGSPLSSDGTSGLGKVSVSNAGRFVSYVFKDKNQSDEPNSFIGITTPEFNNDTDGNLDVVLYDAANQNRKIISRFANGSEAIDEVELEVQIRTDLMNSSPTVGVVFVADHGTLTGRNGHPGHQEVYLYQQPVFDPDVIFLSDFE